MDALERGKDVSGDEEEKVDEFLAWFGRQGGRLCPSFRYAKDNVMGLSVFATCDVEPDMEAILVPKSCCITASLAKRQILKFVGRSDTDDVDVLSGKEWVVLYVFLHKVSFSFGSLDRSEKVPSLTPPRKRAKMETPALDSKLLHLPYIQLLPEETLTPLQYEKGELAMLASTPLYGHAVESRRNGRKSCTKAVKWLRSHRNHFNEEKIDDLMQILEIPQELLSEHENNAPIDIEREAQDWGIDEKLWPVLKVWRWAETAYGSRAFPPRLLGEGEEKQYLTAPVLIPGLDSFNHSRKARVTWTWHEEPKECITLTLHQSLYKDKQVFNSYGPKSNEELIASYGFVNEDMDDDSVTLKLGGIAQVKAAQQHHWRYGEQCPPLLLEEVRAALRQASPDTKDDTADDDLMQQGEAMDVIAGLLEAKITAFEASQMQVENALKEGLSIRESVRHCITMYRQSQIRILRSALEQVQHRLNEIEAMLEGEIS